MPRFAANLSLLYAEHDLVDRYAAAARDGFDAVEVQFPYAVAPDVLAARLDEHGLQQVLFNLPPGRDGERGIACLPGREDDFRRSVDLGLRYAETLRCPRLHVMAGIAAPDADRARLQATYEANLAWAAQQAASAGRDVLIEPINPRDVPGYFLNRQLDAHRTVIAVGAPNLKVQMDLYHCQIVEGDLAMKLREYLPSGRIGHLQIAGVPGRHEPDVGELNHDYLFGVIDELGAACGWTGWIGCEYIPARGAAPGGTSTGLSWLRRARGEHGSNNQA